MAVARKLSRVSSFCLIACAMIGAGTATAQDARRGQYIATLGGCASCHTDDKPGSPALAGGRALKTPFGTFYGSNITPHPDAGIGRWKEEDFVRAMRHGERPDGAPYFPAFPYTSFNKIGDKDLKDLWAYLRTVRPDPRPSRAHELKFPYSVRQGVRLWQYAFFKPGVFSADPRQGADVNLGGYIVQALSHCAECHTPRNALGAMQQDRWLAGGIGPDGKDLPNLTPTNLKKWSDGELKEFLQTGITPDMDSANAAMQEVIDNITSKMSERDLAAVIAYLRSLPALPDAPKAKK